MERPRIIEVKGEIHLSVSEAARKIGEARGTAMTPNKFRLILAQKKILSIKINNKYHYVKETDVEQYIQKSITDFIPGNQKRIVVR